MVTRLPLVGVCGMRFLLEREPAVDHCEVVFASAPAIGE